MKDLIKAENTKKYLRSKGIIAKKGYGQNFLIDENVLHKIITGSGIGKDSLVLEIGPGMGTLTQALCENAGYVTAVELDKDMIACLSENLEGYDNYTVINGDILKVDINQILDESKKAFDRIRQEAVSGDTGNNADGRFVVANLPYYITTPIIMMLLEGGAKISSITVMVQKEVADRMQASPGTKDYGALSLAVQYYADTEIIAKVPGSSFIPAPDVESAVIKLTKKENRRTVDCQGNQEDPVILDDVSEKKMFELIRAAFSQRRKTFVNAVSNSGIMGLTKENVTRLLSENGFDERIRGEKLSLHDYAKLAKSIS